MLTLVPTPIGNLGDISYRSIEALKKADIIFAEDTRVAKKLLKLLEERLSLQFSQKDYISLHSHNENYKLQSLDINIFQKEVVYISDAGMPGVSDPGIELVRYAQNNKIKYDIIPGANAALVARVMSGFGDGGFSFVGFLPHRGQEREDLLIESLHSGVPTILYESPKRVEKLIKEIATIEPDIKLFIAKELTKLHQTWYKDSAKNLSLIMSEINLKGEWVVVIDSKIKPKYDTKIVHLIMQLPLPKKECAKILSKITDKPIKFWYQELLSY